MKNLLFAVNNFSASCLLAHVQIARDLSFFAELVKSISGETPDCLFVSLLASFALLLKCCKMDGSAPQKPSFSNILNFALRATIIFTGDNIVEYMSGLVAGAL